MVNKALLKVPIEEWQKRLVMAPKELVLKTLAATTQLAINVDLDNRSMPRRHFKSRFPFFKHLRLRDEFHADAFYPDIKTAQNQTCAQICMGKDTGYWEVCQLKKDSHALTSFQDFVRHVAMPPALKLDDSRTQTGHKWT